MKIVVNLRAAAPAADPGKKLFGASHLEAFALFPMYIVVKYI